MNTLSIKKDANDAASKFLFLVRLERNNGLIRQPLNAGFQYHNITRYFVPLSLVKPKDNELRPRKAQAQTTSSEAIRSMEEELQFWKMETSILLRMLQQLENRGHNTKASLKVLKEESVFLLENTFLAHEAKLNAIPAKKVKGRYRVQSLEQSHQKIRKAYQKFKLKVLWVLPSFVPITIW